jgi:DNA-binding transcriptional MerR regulator
MAKINETITKRYWLMGDLEGLFNLSGSAIRYYCQYFSITPMRSRNNYRRFTRADVDKLSTILSYVKQGYHLKAIKNKI